MTEAEILKALTTLLRDLLDDESIALKMETVARDVPNFDSAALISFVVAVEIEFNVKFSVATIETFDTFGAIVKAIQALK